MSLTRAVFRCFKCLERAADKVTGAAGPFFIALAWVLMLMGTVTFFDVIAPNLSFRLISIPLCALIAINMLVHYFYACTVPPGFADDRPISLSRAQDHQGWSWAKRRSHARTFGDEGEEDRTRLPARIGQCLKCGSEKPERAHHCRICNRCVLKYDHHCPVCRINQCVGIHNERHFVLFMGYLMIATLSFVFLGIPHLYTFLGFFPSSWPYYSPRMAFILTYILSVALGLAVTVMFSWHIYLICQGQSSVENHDFDHYRKLAERRREVFVNCYDLGSRRNLALFFNITKTGYPLWVLLLPLRTHPYTDGYSWERRVGYDYHGGVRNGEELTDDEDGE